MTDKETPDLFQLEGWNIPVSREAFLLFSHALVNSAVRDRNGFVSDDYLNAIRAATTIAAAELEAAHLWERRLDGYQILDKGSVEISAICAEVFAADEANSTMTYNGTGITLTREDLDALAIVAGDTGASVEQLLRDIIAKREREAGTP
jgi:hypothetical protein